MNRYQVEIKYAVIIYAASSEAAKETAKVFYCEKPAVRPVEVLSVLSLPPIEAEAHGPEVDIAPARETRK